MTTTRSRGFSRRSVLATAGIAAGTGALAEFPAIRAENIKNITLRRFGTGVSNLNAVADNVKQDLGFALTMTALDTDAEGGHPAEILRHRRHRVFHHQEGLPRRHDAADGCEEDQARRQDRANLHQRQADARNPGRAGHHTLFDRLCRRPERQDLRQKQDRMDDADPHHPQRRHAGHPARLSDRSTTERTSSIPSSEGKTSITNIPSIGIMDAAMIMESLGTLKTLPAGSRPALDETGGPIAFCR
jgi:putative spermidine/putrescine transport system substrate-binding protein